MAERERERARARKRERTRKRSRTPLRRSLAGIASLLVSKGPDARYSVMGEAAQIAE